MRIQTIVVNAVIVSCPAASRRTINSRQAIQRIAVLKARRLIIGVSGRSDQSGREVIINAARESC